LLDHEKFFDSIRDSLFGGSLTQSQVDGMSAILEVWDWLEYEDLRWLANGMGQTYHETGGKMWPIEEYGKGKGMSYGVPDPVTGEAYYGRGFIQLTWADNYKYADSQLELEGDSSLYLHPGNALDLVVSASIMLRGMVEGWFRTGKKLPVYFSDTVNDPYNAREIVNGDKHIVPNWSNGVSIGQLCVQYHNKFLAALEGAIVDVTEEIVEGTITVTISGVPKGYEVNLVIRED
jgi:hypothetical protein